MNIKQLNACLNAADLLLQQKIKDAENESLAIKKALVRDYINSYALKKGTIISDMKGNYYQIQDAIPGGYNPFCIRYVCLKLSRKKKPLKNNIIVTLQDGEFMRVETKDKTTCGEC